MNEDYHIYSWDKPWAYRWRPRCVYGFDNGDHSCLGEQLIANHQNPGERNVNRRQRSFAHFTAHPFSFELGENPRSKASSLKNSPSCPFLVFWSGGIGLNSILPVLTIRPLWSFWAIGNIGKFLPGWLFIKSSYLCENYWAGFTLFTLSSGSKQYCQAYHQDTGQR